MVRHARSEFTGAIFAEQMLYVALGAESETSAFRALHHGGDEPDTVAKAIDATGAKGLTGFYVPFTILGLVGRRD
ncbi:hypothetical protein NKI91_28330 [Mesorhizobium sp. M0312]|uniref:hypothetical protein n=1 Tax=Mesorhizobium sp. M0312 TaxID=2956934 RepID=UPI0033375659